MNRESSFEAAMERQAPMRRIVLPVLLILAGLALPRFVGAADASGIDPCRLVTNQEAAAFFGAAVAASAPLSPRPHKGDTPVRMCSFRSVDGGMFTIAVGAKTKEGWDREKKGQKPIAGLGDEAYEHPPTNVVAWKRDVEVAVMSIDTTGGGADAARMEKMKTLARMAASRLP